MWVFNRKLAGALQPTSHVSFVPLDTFTWVLFFIGKEPIVIKDEQSKQVWLEEHRQNLLIHILKTAMKEFVYVDPHVAG